MPFYIFVIIFFMDYTIYIYIHLLFRKIYKAQIDIYHYNNLIMFDNY